MGAAKCDGDCIMVLHPAAVAAVFQRFVFWQNLLHSVRACTQCRKCSGGVRSHNAVKIVCELESGFRRKLSTIIATKENFEASRGPCSVAHKAGALCRDKQEEESVRAVAEKYGRDGIAANPGWPKLPITDFTVAALRAGPAQRPFSSLADCFFFFFLH